MDSAAWIGLAAVVVALVALYFTGHAAVATKAQADAAKAQTDIQRELQRQAAQPYVWVDIRLDAAQPSLITIVLGNSGPTVATNIRVTFDPDLPKGTLSGNRDEDASGRLAAGIKSLPPGRKLTWALGTGPKLLGVENPGSYSVMVEADGPFGPTDPLEYFIDLADFRETLDNPDGSLHLVRKSIDDLKSVIRNK